METTVETTTTQLEALKSEIANVQKDLDAATRKLIITRKNLESKKQEFETEMNQQQADAKAKFELANDEAIKIQGEKEALIDKVDKLEYNYDPVSSANADQVEELEN